VRAASARSQRSRGCRVVPAWVLAPRSLARLCRSCSVRQRNRAMAVLYRS
jgi:hypothetical protein